MSSQTRHVFFIDARVADYETLIGGLPADSEWFVLDADRDGITQMQSILADYSGLDSIQIISHGAPATLYLGSSVVTPHNLAQYETALKKIGGSLTETGDVLLYGCNVAQGDSGRQFIETLALFTGADVAASDDLTGAGVLGGDDELEAATGPVEQPFILTQGQWDQVNILLGMTPQIAAGIYHSLAIKADGTLWAWGENDYGQFGNGTNTDSTTPIQVGTGFTDVEAGSGYTVALRVDGSLWAWGYNSWGQLGDGTRTDSSLPIQIGTGFTEIDVGFGHALALRADGSLWAWGSNGYGTLGDGTTNYSFTPKLISTGFIDIAAGWDHSLALKADGSLWSFGKNYDGQLGAGAPMGTYTAFSTPVLVGTGFTEVAAGRAHSLAIKADGSLWAWGDNGIGQLGNGTQTDANTPIQIGTGFTDIAAGGNTSLALKPDGSLWAWGSNANLDTGFYSHTPIHVGSGYTDISAGYVHNLALKSDGNLWAWGWNQDQLGHSGTQYYNAPVEIMQLGTADNDAIQNQAPTLNGSTTITKLTGESFTFTPLISASDLDGMIASYTFYDATPGAGYLTLNGTKINGTSVSISASELSQIGYFTGSTAGSNDIAIQAFDNQGAGSVDLNMTISVTSANVVQFPSVPVNDTNVYLSTDRGSIYTWNLATGVVTLATQTGLPLTDIALDPDGRLFGITGDELYRLDPETGDFSEIGLLQTLHGELYFGVSALTDANGFDISPTGVGRISSGNNHIVTIINLETGHVSNEFGPLGLASSAGDLWYTNENNYWMTTTSSTLVEAGPTSTGGEVKVSDRFIASGTVDGLVSAPSGATLVVPDTLVGFVGKTAYALGESQFALGPGLAILNLDGNVTGATVLRGSGGVDTQAPTVASFRPLDEAASVPVDSSIVVTFSEAIQRGTGDIVLKTATGVTVATYNAATSSNLAFSGNTLTINPTANLANNTGYKVEFAAGSIKDLAGNNYAGTTSYNFKTLDMHVMADSLLVAAVNLAARAYSDAHLGTNASLVNTEIQGWTPLSPTALGYLVDDDHFSIVGGNLLRYESFNASASVGITMLDGKRTLGIGFEGTNKNEVTDFAQDLLLIDSNYWELSGFADAVAAYADGNQIEQILVSGHSLGGSSAQLFMLSYGDQDERYVGVTFGSPGTAALTWFPTIQLVNIIHSEDPVPILGNVRLYNNYGVDVYVKVDNPELNPLNEHTIWSSDGLSYNNTIEFLNDHLHLDGFFNKDLYIVAGTENPDQLIGSWLNDILVGGAGNDAIHGESGKDVVVYSGQRSDYQIDWLSQYLNGVPDYSVKDLNSSDGDDGTDSLWSIEVLRFADQEVALRRTFLGFVLDGYVAGASLFIDDDGNGQADPGENTGAVTDAQGYFTFDSTLFGPILAIGGTNIDTGLANTLQLSAPAGSTVVTPLTTLVQQIVYLQDMDPSAAETLVQNALGITADVDLTQYDPLAQGDSDATGLAVQQVAAQVATLVTLAPQGDTSFTSIAAAIARAGSQPLDLGSASVLQTILPTENSTTLARIATINQAITATGTLTDIAIVQESAQNNSNDAPVLLIPLLDLHTSQGVAFAWTFPENTFADLDVGDTMSYSATLTNGEALPTWLSFNAATRCLSGTPSSTHVGTLDIQVTASDSSGASVSDALRLSVGTDSIAPTATSFSPADGAAGVAIGSNIVITFSEAIQRGTGNIVLKTTAGTVVATYNAATSSNLTVAGNSLTLNPSTDLTNYTDYKVEFAAGSVKDLSGNPYAGTTSYNFTTLLRIEGTSGADTLYGSQNADPIFGLAGNDVIHPGLGNDTIDGGEGTDTVVLTGLASSYAFSLLADASVRVQSNETDSLNSIEIIQFGDGSTHSIMSLLPRATLDAPAYHAKVQSYFFTTIGRAATDTELTNYSALLASQGGSVWKDSAGVFGNSGSLVGALFASAEFNTLTNTLAASNDYGQIVEDMFGRLTGQSTLDATIFDYYVSQLSSGSIKLRGLANAMLNDLSLMPRNDNILSQPNGWPVNWFENLAPVDYLGYLNQLELVGINVSNLDASGVLA